VGEEEAWVARMWSGVCGARRGHERDGREQQRQGHDAMVDGSAACNGGGGGVEGESPAAGGKKGSGW